MLKFSRLGLVVSLLCAAPAVAVVSASSAEAAELTGQQIVEQMLDKEALGFQTGQVSMTLLVQDAGGESRERRLTIRGMQEQGQLRALVRVTAPSEVSGQAYLFRESAKGEDDFYVFMPALDDAPRRISGSQKNGSFMGTHLSYSDLESRDLKEGTYTRQPDEKVGNADCYRVEVKPKQRSAGQAASTVAWVRKSDMMPLRVRYFDDKGAATKTLFVEQTAVSGGKSYVRRLTIRPASGGSTTRVLDTVDFAVVPAAAEMTPQALAR